jgi:hypothetical protein
MRGARRRGGCLALLACETSSGGMDFGRSTAWFVMLGEFWGFLLEKPASVHLLPQRVSFFVCNRWVARFVRHAAQVSCLGRRDWLAEGNLGLVGGAVASAINQELSPRKDPCQRASRLHHTDDLQGHSSPLLTPRWVRHGVPGTASRIQMFQRRVFPQILPLSHPPALIGYPACISTGQSRCILCRASPIPPRLFPTSARARGWVGRTRRS